MSTPEVQEILLSNEGYCPICGARTRFESTHVWLRDFYICKICKTCPRQRATAMVIEQVCPNWRELSMHELSPCIPFFSSHCKKYTSSYYFSDIQPGYVDVSSGKRCENVEDLTYSDNTFDIFMHQDVLEHVFHPEKAMREVMRVLKPGGLHIFTAPKNKQLLASEPRAKLENGQVRHIKPEQFHGDPKDPNGVLVTWDYGADFEDLLSAFGGYLINTYVIRDRRYGIDGEYLEVFFSWKLPVNQLTDNERKQLLRNLPHGQQYLPLQRT